MYTEVLWWVAGISTGLFALKLLAMIFGADSNSDFDIDVDHDGALDMHSMSGDIQLLSVTTVLTFIMMGSWTTLTAYVTFEMSQLQSIGAGLIGGVVVAFFVAWILAKMRSLESDGTLKDFDPRGMRGKVYVSIPSSGEGEGQIQLEVQGSVRTFRAVSEKDPIESFKPVIVTGMTSDHVMLVRPAT